MQKFDYNIVKDPRIFDENRLPAHSDHLFYTDKPKKAWDPSDLRYCLSGVWKFSYAVNEKSAVEGFEEPSFDCTGWDEIRVPGHIQLQGYDRPAYINAQYPWDGSEDLEPGMIPEEYNPTATYVKDFVLPEKMRGQEVHIVFDGAESGIAVWLNGQYIGYSEDSFTPSEFDLTPWLKEGTNRLAARVFKWTSGSWCESQDMFRFSGIFRDVWLVMIPKLHVNDLHIVSSVDDNYRNAEIKIDLQANAEGSVKVVLTDPDGRTAAQGSCSLKKKTEEEAAQKDGPAGSLGACKGSLSLFVKNAALWSAEIPNLYEVEISVLNKEGRITEWIVEKTGLRRFEMKDHIMHLNGKRIVFKGVNRHEFSADRGRAIDASVILKDLVTMKRNNINAVRTCHYPNQTALYRMCDELGLYVIDETNQESHGAWDMVMRGIHPLSWTVPGDRPEYLDMLLDRGNSMYQRDKNHASILLWSLGNESLGGKDFLEFSKFLHRQDSTRLVHYEGVAHDDRYPETTDVVSTMYTPAKDVDEYLKAHPDKPYILCEYAHSMGNSTGALYKYTELAKTNPLYQGGFIWDYIDQALILKDRFGKEYLGYGGDFDERPNDGNFSGNGIVYAKDRAPSPKMQEVKHDYQSIDISFEGDNVVICNRNLFLDTDAYRCIMTVAKDGVEIERNEGSILVKPGETSSFPVPLEIPQEPAEYVVTVSFVLKEDTAWAPKGHEAAFGQNVIDKREVKADRKDTDISVKVVIGAVNVGVIGSNFRVLFSTLQGGLISYVYGGKELLKRMPRPNFWRAMTDNDVANQQPWRSAQWRNAGVYASTKYAHGRMATDYTVKKTEDGVEVKFIYHLPVTPEKDCEVTYRVHADGTVDVLQEMAPSGDVGELPEFSMLFTLDASLNRLRWYGIGPEETYPDRKNGKIGIYENAVLDNLSRYLRPQECGNHMDVRWAEVTDSEGRGLHFDTNCLQFSALPCSPEELECAQHPNELPPFLYTFVRVGEQMGIGGDDTWGALVHPEYLLDNKKEMKICFSFKGI